MVGEASKRYRIEDTFPTGGHKATPLAAPTSRPISAEDVAKPSLAAGPGGVSAAAPHETVSRDEREVERMGREFRAMKAAIDKTKRELRSLQGLAPGETPMLRAASELDEVVASTERATTAILGAVEEIEAAATSLRDGDKCAPGGDRELGVIHDRVVALYEACNFQDLTGQRIRKVVGTLKFLEDCLDIIILRGEGVEKRETAPLPPAPPSALLNGPPLPGEHGHVSQTDVDAYFV
jgi:chemotaxis protein CheZ